MNQSNDIGSSSAKVPECLAVSRVEEEDRAPINHKTTRNQNKELPRTEFNSGTTEKAGACIDRRK